MYTLEDYACVEYSYIHACQSLGMVLSETTKRVRSARYTLASVINVILHWISTVAAAGVAYVTYNEADALFFAAIAIGFIAALLFVRSIGVTIERFR